MSPYRNLENLLSTSFNVIVIVCRIKLKLGKHISHDATNFIYVAPT